MDKLIDKVFTQPWFWCVMIPLLIATAAAAVDKHDLMIGMFIVAGVSGVGFGFRYAADNGYFQ